MSAELDSHPVLLLFSDKNFILLKGKAGSHIWKKWKTKDFDKARLRKEEVPLIEVEPLTQEWVAAQTLELMNKTKPKLIVRLG